MGGYKVFAIIL